MFTPRLGTRRVKGRHTALVGGRRRGIRGLGLRGITGCHWRLHSAQNSETRVGIPSRPHLALHLNQRTARKVLPGKQCWFSTQSALRLAVRMPGGGECPEPLPTGGQPVGRQEKVHPGSLGVWQASREGADGPPRGAQGLHGAQKAPVLVPVSQAGHSQPPTGRYCCHPSLQRGKPSSR